MRKVIYLNAGHWTNDPGASNKLRERERDFTIKIRDALIPKLKWLGFEIKAVPDSLNLIKTIAWINARSNGLNSGLAIGIHLNAGGGTGTECFGYNNSSTSLKLASILSRVVASNLGFRNRGAKPDTKSAVKRLGFIRNTKPWALVLEVGFIDNPKDMKAIRKIENVAVAIAKGICKIYGMEYQLKQSPTKLYNNAEKAVYLRESEIKKLRVQVKTLKGKIAQIRGIVK